MPDRKSLIPIFEWLVIAALVLVAPEGRANSVLDLAEFPPETNIAMHMEGFEADAGAIPGPEQALARGNWVPLSMSRDLLRKPREQDTLWLRATLVNPQSDALKRWLEFLPLHLDSVDAWIINPQTGEVLEHIRSGLRVPVESRKVKSLRPVIPVTVPAKGSRDLVIRVHSDVRGFRIFLDVHSWEPVQYVSEQAARYQFHMILLAVIVTIAAVLFLQLNIRITLLGCWMLLLFFLQLDKEGYLSHFVFNDLAGEIVNWRYTISLLEKGLFLAISIYLLGLSKLRGFRWLIVITVSVTVLAILAGLFLTEVRQRYLGSTLHFLYAIAWLFLLPQALRIRDKWQWMLLALLGSVWFISLIFVVSFAFDFHYQTQLVPERTYVKILIVLGLLLVYNLQKKEYEKSLKQTLYEKEQQERKRLENLVDQRSHELSTALEAARAANASKSDFLNRVTHDLKSPLTSIMGYSQLLSTEVGKTGEIGLIIYTSAQQMLNKVARLIGSARGSEPAEPPAMNIYLQPFLDAILYEAKVLAEKSGNYFHLEVGDLVFPVVRTDETALREMLINLINEACRQSSNRDIVLRVECIPSHDSRECGLRFSLCGLETGFSAVNGLVEKLCGRIALENDSQGGACVVVEVPVQEGEEGGDAALLNTPSHLLPWFDATGLVAWVVDDAPAINELLVLELESLCFDVRSFQSAESLVAELEKGKAPPDLVLTDYRLPGASGDAVLRAMRSHAPGVPVVLLSATWSRNNQSREGEGEGFDACMGKPIDLAHMRRTIAQVLSISLTAPTEAIVELKARKRSQAPCQFLAPETVDQLEQWIEQGAVTDLLEWCDQFEDDCPSERDFAGRIRSRAERGDFAAISKLIAERVRHSER